MSQTPKPLTRYEVFVPGFFPVHNYVKRQFLHARTQKPFDPEYELSVALKQPGMIAQVVGPSKSGKTRAVEYSVGPEKLVPVAGAQLTDPTSLWVTVCRQRAISLAGEDGESRGTATSHELGSEVEGDVFIASATGSYSWSREQTKEQDSRRTTELDPFEAATRFLKAHDLVLFLDDFHTIPADARPGVAAQLKAAAQIGVRICLAEVPHHSDSTIAALPDLTGRIIKIPFQYWRESDLVAIGRDGFEALNSELTDANLIALAAEAAGSPQLMQLLCLKAAEESGIEVKLDQRQHRQLSIGELRHVFVHAQEYVDREKIFRLLDEGPDERGKPRSRYAAMGLGTGDNYEITLAAISLDPPMASLSWNTGADNIQRRIERICPTATDRPARGQITRALEALQGLAEKHMANLQLLEWGPDIGLQILDPYFLFYLRWSEKYEKVRGAVH